MDFLKYNKRFSFKLGGMNAWDLDYKSEVTSIGNEVTTVYQFGGGIKITNIAKKYDKLNYMDVLNEGLQVMDSTAISMCMDNDIDLVVFNMNEPGNIVKAVNQQVNGTLITKKG